MIDNVMIVLRPPRGTRRRRIDLGGFAGEWIWQRSMPDPGDAQDAVLLYLHGGGLASCGLNTHRRLVARIGAVAGVPALNVAYRQIPEAHVTATVEDCLAAYRYLLEQGFSAERIVIAGDSAGGGLAFAVALAARGAGLPVARAIAAIAPWADYDSAARRSHPNDAVDPFLSSAILHMPTRWGMAIDGILDAAWSPVNHSFGGMPPVFIQVGSTEVLLADTCQLVRACADANVPVHVQIWDKAVHVFQIYADLVPDARDAIAELGRFIGNTIAAVDTLAASTAWTQEMPA